MTDPVDELVGCLGRMDLSRLGTNAKLRTENFVRDVEGEREMYRGRYENLEARLSEFSAEVMAQDLVNFNRFDWKLDWVKIIQGYKYDPFILRAFGECRNVKISGDEMLALFGDRPDQVDVFAATFQKGFYAFDTATTPLHFARLPAPMFAAVVSSPNIDFASDVDTIIWSPLVCPENKRAVYELFTGHWMTKPIPERNPYIVDVLEMITAVADNDQAFCRLLCNATLKLTASATTTTTPTASAPA
jgi:hypothetical protein